jgi:hypothetical protein
MTTWSILFFERNSFALRQLLHPGCKNRMNFSVGAFMGEGLEKVKGFKRTFRSDRAQAFVIRLAGGALNG